ncbi:hypothetical protein Hanom_Chr08g00714491 [Helianthus anomalus]
MESPAKKAPESGSVKASEFERVEDGRMNTEGDVVRVSIRESQVLHGENSTNGNNNYDMGPDDLMAKKAVGEPQLLEEIENCLVDQFYSGWANPISWTW